MNAAIINETAEAGSDGRLSPHHHCKGVSGMASTSVAPRTFNREDLAWAAGFYDGEGHTRTGRSLGVVVSQSLSPELLERFKRAVGVGNVHGPFEYRHKRPSQKPFYTYGAVSFESAQHCICCLWPWLGSAKRAQASNALRTWHAHPRKWSRARKGHSRLICRRGHRVEGANAYMAKNGQTVCRECRRIWERGHTQKMKAAS